MHAAVESRDKTSIKRVDLRLILVNLSLLIFSVWFFIKFIMPLNSLSSLTGEAKPVCPKCNVILISLDTLGSNHLPCYGYNRNTAPFLCRFAKENIFFINSYSNASQTLPSHFSIFTSLYPSHHNMMVPLRDYLDHNIKTITQLLKNNGYQTWYVGITTATQLPLDKGLGRGFDFIINDDTISNWETVVKELRKNTEDQKPTFIFFHTYWVHAPYLVEDRGGGSKRLFTNQEFSKIPLTQKDFRTFSKGFYDYVLDSFESRVKSSYAVESLRRNRAIYSALKRAKSLKQAEKIFNDLPGFEQFSFYMDYYFDKSIDVKDKEQIEYIKALYDETIFYLDRRLKKFFSSLLIEPIAKKTIIIITADHGEEFFEHGNTGHGINLYNTNTAVPLIMYIPGIKKREIDNLVEGVDIFPTVANLLGISFPKNLDGADLSELIVGKEKNINKNYLISELSYKASIRDERWKLYMGLA